MIYSRYKVVINERCSRNEAVIATKVVLRDRSKDARRNLTIINCFAGLCKRFNALMRRVIQTRIHRLLSN